MSIAFVYSLKAESSCNRVSSRNPTGFECIRKLTEHDLWRTVPPRSDILGHISIGAHVQIRLGGRSGESKVADLEFNKITGRGGSSFEYISISLRFREGKPARGGWTDFEIAIRVQE
jgi:hypothetical protein